jgi:hypothetical protein
MNQLRVLKKLVLISFMYGFAATVFSQTAEG